MGAKGARPALPLWLLLVAAFAPDWIETFLIGLGMTDTGLWTHSLPAVLVIAAAFTLAVKASGRSWRDAAFVGAVCVSHVLVDWFTGRKPLGIGKTVIGLHLYGHPIIDFALELVVITVGWMYYRRSLPGAKQRHPLAFALLGGLLLLQAVFDWKFTGG